MDDSIGLRKGVTVKLKSDFPTEYDCIKSQLGVSPKYFRTDCGSKNVSKKFEEQLAADGTHHERSAPDWQNQNGR
eukprot:1809344-Rhodomonas_salina.1